MNLAIVAITAKFIAIHIIPNNIQMKVLLIDLENCPSQINELLENLENYSQVVICYAQSGAKIPIDWILPLTKVVNDDHLKIIKMPTIGKNAADFGITFWAGVLMAQLGEQTHFDIISNDADLDYVVELLNNENRSATRIGIKKSEIVYLPTPKPIKAQDANIIQQSFNEYCSYLADRSTENRPARETTLLNSIKSHFKNVDVNSDDILALLFKHTIVAINNGSTIYNNQKLNPFKTK
jgi:hypothetical protein